jgi:hypothetical protein
MDRAGSPFPSHLVVSIFVQSLLYGRYRYWACLPGTELNIKPTAGAFCVISVLNYWALMLRRSYNPHPKKSLFSLSLIMFVLATLVRSAGTMIQGAPGTTSNSYLITAYNLQLNQCAYWIQVYCGKNSLPASYFKQRVLLLADAGRGQHRGTYI